MVETVRDPAVFDSMHLEDVTRVVRAIHSAVSAPLNGALVREPQWARIVDHDARIDWRNSVLHSELDPDVADSVIERVVAEQRASGLPLGWYVSPLSKPDDLGERLRRKNFALTEVMLAMAANVNELNVGTTPADVSVEPVTEETLSELFAVHHLGWGTPIDVVRAREHEARERFDSEKEIKTRFLARIEGRAVGISTLRFDEDAAHFCGSVVLPEFRKRGVYSALFGSRVDYAKRRSMEHITVHCKADTSAPICRKYGFRDICEINFYQLQD